MTEEQALQIQYLRAQGMGYRRIASATLLSRDTVRNYCRAKGLLSNLTKSDLDVDKQIKQGNACPYCGGMLEQQSIGRPRRFCSELCRRNYWKIHREEQKRSAKAIYTMECLHCHEIFESYGNKKRKYCCHEHYILYRFGKKEGRMVQQQEKPFSKKPVTQSGEEGETWTSL